MTTITEIKNLTDEELRVRVAELDGWQDVFALGGIVCGVPQGKRITENAYRGDVPDYPRDLNAVRIVISKLSHEQRHAYAVILAGFFWPMGWSDWRDTLAVSEAAARIRCEALVLTLSEK
jgi:hypothetical protein